MKLQLCNKIFWDTGHVPPPLRQIFHCTQFLDSFMHCIGTTRHDIEEGRGREGDGSVGAVVGGTIATLLVVAVIAVLVFAALWWWSKR